MAVGVVPRVTFPVGCDLPIVAATVVAVVDSPSMHRCCNSCSIESSENGAVRQAIDS